MRGTSGVLVLVLVICCVCGLFLDLARAMHMHAVASMGGPNAARGDPIQLALESILLPHSRIEAIRSPLLQCRTRRIALQADTGNFLARCRNCAQHAAYPHASLAFHVTDFDGNLDAQWDVELVSRYSIALRSAAASLYVTRCRGCYWDATYDDSATMHAETPIGAPYAVWSIVVMADGKVALEGDLGGYLARCRHCIASGTTEDFAFVHEHDPMAAWAQFTVVCVDGARQ